MKRNLVRPILKKEAKQNKQLYNTSSYNKMYLWLVIPMCSIKQNRLCCNIIKNDNPHTYDAFFIFITYPNNSVSHIVRYIASTCELKN